MFIDTAKVTVQKDPREMPAMESIEVFIIEDEYGNTVFVDELMTGKWN